MDQSFFLRAQRMLGHGRPLPIDHGLLVAALAAHQAASVTAGAEAKAREGEEAGTRPPDPLPDLILGGAGWRTAAVLQQGCFNRAIAMRCVNAS